MSPCLLQLQFCALSSSSKLDSKSFTLLLLPLKTYQQKILVNYATYFELPGKEIGQQLLLGPYFVYGSVFNSSLFQCMFRICSAYAPSMFNLTSLATDTVHGFEKGNPYAVCSPVIVFLMKESCLLKVSIALDAFE